MNQFFRIIILAVLVATSCSRDVDLIDGNDLPKILADIYMTDRSVLNSQINMQKADTSLIYEPILNKYGYTTEDFVYTMDYYLPRPAKLKSYFIKAKEILEERELNVEKIISAQNHRESLLAPIRDIIEEVDSFREMDSYERSVRWILAPNKLPIWHIYLQDSLASRYEIPKLEQWWLNNLTTKRKSFLEYAKNSGPISLPIEQSTDPERLSLPPH
ncbi:MAG: DUF4296 domain-containing protein [Bacteroidales bacterium]